jgi:hypothetical protein
MEDKLRLQVRWCRVFQGEGTGKSTCSLAIQGKTGVVEDLATRHENRCLQKRIEF